MYKSCTKKYTDESDEKTFRFTFYCDACGEPFCASPVLFTGNGPPGKPDGEKHWRLLWKREHGKAFERANFEAAHRFYNCPGCGLFVCDKCTVFKQDEDGDMRRERCVNCDRRTRWGSYTPHLKYVYEPDAENAEQASTESPPLKGEKRRWGSWRKKGSQA